MQLLSVSCHSGVFRHPVYHPAQLQREKKALTSGHLFMALPQLCESLNRLTKISESEIQIFIRPCNGQLGANIWPSLHPVLCTDNSAQQNGGKRPDSKMSCLARISSQKWAKMLQSMSGLRLRFNMSDVVP